MYKLLKIFTFHNVSINTAEITGGAVLYKTLHSTMFLLILLRTQTLS